MFLILQVRDRACLLVLLWKVFREPMDLPKEKRGEEGMSANMIASSFWLPHAHARALLSPSAATRTRTRTTKTPSFMLARHVHVHQPANNTMQMGASG